MVFDTLYGLDDMGQSRPQMCAGHDVSADGLTWTFTLRDGLTFHDGERVLAKDCAMSVRRWGSRDLFGQPLLAATNDIETIDGVTRRTSREPVNQGGWSCFITQIEGVAACTPGGSFELRGNGAKAWFGWPDDEELERLRTAWTPDLPAQKAIAEKVQMRALETLPCIPLGQLFQPTAFRADITDIVKAAFPLFWGVRRA